MFRHHSDTAVHHSEQQLQVDDAAALVLGDPPSRDHRGPIQPTSPFRRSNNTAISQASTADQYSHLFQQDKYPLSHEVEGPKESGVPLDTDATPHTPTRRNAGSHPATPFSPTRLANVAVRRTQHASALVASPPRPGHSSGMRRIFEVARIGQVLPDDGSVSYPVLPGIAQKVVAQAHIDDGGKPSKPITESISRTTHRPSITSNPSSSGFWTVGSKSHVGQSSSRAPPSEDLPQTHIDDWLSRVPLLDGPSYTYSADGVEPRPVCRTQASARNRFPLSRPSPIRLPKPSVATCSPQQTPSKYTSEEDGETEDATTLQLSRAVSTERGPSRWRSARKICAVNATPRETCTHTSYDPNHDPGAPATPTKPPRGQHRRENSAPSDTGGEKAHNHNHWRFYTSTRTSRARSQTLPSNDTTVPSIGLQ